MQQADHFTVHGEARGKGKDYEEALKQRIRKKNLKT
jgi:hypothetical protein